MGQFAREQLPENAVLFCQEWKGGEHLTMMFYADRTCYPMAKWRSDETGRQVVEAGGAPYLVTQRKLPLPAVYVSGQRGLTVYQWRQ